MTDDNAPWNDEFGLIKKLLSSAPDWVWNKDRLKVPPGDDAALICPLTRPVITTDTQRERIHFRLDWQKPEEIGAKAVEITFSDLAASYATPVSLFVNLSLPPHISEHMVLALYSGIYRALTRYGCTLGGGNISGSDQLAIDLFAVGQGHEDIFPQRSNALADEGLYCTGPLGLSRAGMDALYRKDLSFKNLIDKFKSPTARFDAAMVLAKHRVACVTDISDGLIGDAQHIAAASNISIQIDTESCAVDSGLLSYCRTYRLSPQAMMLSGGEDYELLFTCHPETFHHIRQELPGVYQVGRCRPYEGQFLLNIPPDLHSYQHGDRLGERE